jgi:ABC-type protease/lipase transport system fused ATPase/permease subunit
MFTLLLLLIKPQRPNPNTPFSHYLDECEILLFGYFLFGFFLVLFTLCSALFFLQVAKRIIGLDHGRETKGINKRFEDKKR